MKSALGFVLLLASVMFAADWPRFRGPNGSGVAETAALPSQMGPATHVDWKTAVPFGRSSPVVSGSRVYLTASEGNSLLTLAYDLSTGRELWRRSVPSSHQQNIYKANDPASPTAAVADGSLYVFFPDFGLLSYTAEGKERWRHPLGPFENFYGMASSPVVSGGMVFLLCDQASGSYLLAVDAKTGKQRWRTDRKNHHEGWSVPIVHEDQILTIGSTCVDAYYPSTGEHRWWMPLSTSGAMGTPVVFGDSVLVTALGLDKPWLPPFADLLLKLDKDKDSRLSTQECKDETDWVEHFGWADSNHDGFLDATEWTTARDYGVGESGVTSIPLNGKGRLETSAIRWRFKRNTAYVPAPVLYDGVFYMVKTGGIVTSLDPTTGTLLKQGRATGATGSYYSSPVAGDGKVFLVSEEGKLTVLKAGAQWEVLSVNDLGEECYATPAIADGRLIVRTRSTLFAFAEASKP